MGKPFDRAQAYRRENTEAIDRGKRQGNVLTAVLLGILAGGYALFIAALVNGW